MSAVQVKRIPAKSKKPPPPAAWPEGKVLHSLREGALVLVIGAALYLLIALASYHPDDPGWTRQATVAPEIYNAAGRAGAWIADVLLFMLGYLAYLLPFVVAYLGWRACALGLPRDGRAWWLRAGGMLLVVLTAAALLALHGSAVTALVPGSAGGALGALISAGLFERFNVLGATLILLAILFAALTWATGWSWVRAMDRIGAGALRCAGFLRRRSATAAAALSARRAAAIASAAALSFDSPPARKAAQRRSAAPAARDADLDEMMGAAAGDPYLRPFEAAGCNSLSNPLMDPLLDPLTDPDLVSAQLPFADLEPADAVLRGLRAARMPLSAGLPPLALLDPPETTSARYSAEALDGMARLVEARLADFNIPAQVVATHPGPVITRLELMPGPGIKVAQISNLAKDLARALSVVSVRVVEIIPGKSVVGLEIPNQQRELVRLSEVLQHEAYAGSASPLTLALGKDIGGRPLCVDLARMPHLLVAGTTGSGKSVAVNAMILSLLYKATPDQVRLLMIDPKMLELSVYEGIPHLLTPVVTEMKEAATALRWCVAEMERRYRLMASLGVRQLAGHNRKVLDAIAAGRPIADPFPRRGVDGALLEADPTLAPLPALVVIIDELADMMMVVGKKVEELIARLAQKARASGIHLILATQRPSVDVITGLIKANIPSRIAFQVSSKIDSRTILDQMGAEALLGQGDMLYLAPGTGLPVRVHGAFVADQEVHQVAAWLKQNGAADYLPDVLNDLAEGTAGGVPGLPGMGDDDGESDPLYDQAVHVVTQTRRASISGVQRRLKIGYNRAARLLETMEQAGIVGSLQSNGSRDVLAPPPPERE